MTKYIKQRLSVKIFIITFFLLGTACSGTYFFISKLLPVTYSNLINVSTEKAAMHLVEQMTAFDNISDCENDISNFSKETNAAFWIEDSNGRMIYPDEASTETSTTSADCTVTFDEDESLPDTFRIFLYVKLQPVLSGPIKNQRHCKEGQKSSP